MWSRAAKQSHKHGFHLVVGVVGTSDKPNASASCLIRQRRVPIAAHISFTRRRAVFRGAVDGKEVRTESFGKLLNSPLVSIHIGGRSGSVTGEGKGKLGPGARERQTQSGGVGPTATGDQRRLPRGLAALSGDQGAPRGDDPA